MNHKLILSTSMLLAAAGCGLGAFGARTAWKNQPVKADAHALTVVDTAKVAGVAPAAGDAVAKLAGPADGGATVVSFRCGKTAMGVREYHEGRFERLAGAALYDPKAKVLRAVEVRISCGSLWSDVPALTNTVLHAQKWFDLEKHPEALFSAAECRPLAGAKEGGPTHELVGRFTLNGITQPLTLPVALAFDGSRLRMSGKFTLSRAAFQVADRTNGIQPSKVDDEVEMGLEVSASPDLGAAVADLGAELTKTRNELVETRQRLEAVERTATQALNLAKEGGGRPAAPVAMVDESKLPKSFADQVPYAAPVDFDMVLVPGDAAAGIAPFYMGKTEVTWEMVKAFVECTDSDDAEENKRSANEAAKAKQHADYSALRPSNVLSYKSALESKELGKDEQPVSACSRFSAERFCEWLGAKTGRKYRLPTDREWLHAAKAGGGKPSAPDEARFADTVKKDPTGLLLLPAAGSGAPNKLGIHDLFGSVAEWVTGTGADRQVRGGSFMVPSKEVSPDWKLVETPEWVASYRIEPKTISWFSDRPDVGFRLVCDAAEAAKSPAAGPAKR